MPEFISIREDGDLAIVGIDRPPANAMDPALLEEGRAAARELEERAPAGIVLHGRPGFFSAGLDLKLVPELDSLFRAIPELKDSMQVNVELASPDDFIPELQGWQERSRFVATYGQVSFLHYDLYAQALAKIERGHEQDRADVRAMLERGLIEPAQLLAFFGAIEPRLYRYPAVEPRAFKAALARALAQPRSGD